AGAVDLACGQNERSSRNTPAMPRGNARVVSTKRPPRKNSQISGAAPVSQVFARLTSTAPIIAPTRVPRPPTETQIATSIEEPGDAGQVKTEPGSRQMHVPAKDVFIIGQAVIAAETHVVAEEGEPQSVGHRLGDDREVDAGHPRAKRQPAKDKGKDAGHQDDH